VPPQAQRGAAGKAADAGVRVGEPLRATRLSVDVLSRTGGPYVIIDHSLGRESANMVRA